MSSFQFTLIMMFRTFSSILSVVAAVSFSFPFASGSEILANQRDTNQNIPKVYKDDLLRFQFQDCERSSSSLTCSFTVTNTGSSSIGMELCDINNVGFTRLVDASGNEYRATELQLGQARESSRARYYCVRFVQTSLPPTVPLRGSATFQVPQSVSDFALMEVTYLRGTYPTGSNHSAMFRNITSSSGK